MNELAVFPVRGAANSFRNVRADTVSRSNQLFANGIAGKVMPAFHDRPDSVGKLFGQSVHVQVLKI